MIKAKDYKPATVEDKVFIDFCRRNGVMIVSMEQELTKTEVEMIERKLSEIKPYSMSLKTFNVACQRVIKGGLNEVLKRPLDANQKQQLASLDAIKSGRIQDSINALLKNRPANMTDDIWHKVLQDCNIDNNLTKPLTREQIERVKNHRSVQIAKFNLEYEGKYQKQVTEFSRINTTTRTGIDDLRDDLDNRISNIRNQQKENDRRREVEFIGKGNPINTIESKRAQEKLNSLYRQLDAVREEYVGQSKFSKEVHSKKLEMLEKKIKKMTEKRGYAIQLQKQIINKN